MSKWDRHSIKAALHREGMTLNALAALNGLEPTYFRKVWTHPNRKAEAAIATFLKVPVEELFPNRYPIRTSRILSNKYDGALASAKKRKELDKASAA